jgi:hypothetical protein
LNELDSSALVPSRWLFEQGRSAAVFMNAQALGITDKRTKDREIPTQVCNIVSSHQIKLPATILHRHVDARQIQNLDNKGTKTNSN